MLHYFFELTDFWYNSNVDYKSKYKCKCLLVGECISFEERADLYISGEILVCAINPCRWVSVKYWNVWHCKDLSGMWYTVKDADISNLNLKCL